VDQDADLAQLLVERHRYFLGRILMTAVAKLAILALA
jgi:hypothetical protein